MRRRFVLLASLVCVFAVLGSSAPPRAQGPATRYTFTRIADHGFVQAVLGQPDEPQFIDVGNSWGPSLNDDGTVAFGHAARFPFNRTVVSVGDGAAITQAYGGGSAAPSTDILGIDGQGRVYVLVSLPDPLCPSVNCIVRLTPGSSLPEVLVEKPGVGNMNFLVNGAHPRLQSGAPPLLYHFEAATGIEYHTSAGLVAATGGQFTGIVAGEHDINASGEVVFMAQTAAGFGIFAARSGQAARTVFLNYSNPAGVGFVNIHGLGIDDAGRVFFSANSGESFNSVYRSDLGSEEPTLVIDANSGALFPVSRVAVNGAGSLAFAAARGLNGPIGIYTGPDPDVDKVVEVGDLLDGRLVLEIRLGERAINNNGVDGRGQILFAAALDLNGSGTFDEGDGYSLYRANPPGATPDNPVLPLAKAPGSKQYKFAAVKKAAQGATVCYWDPPIAIGYEYTLAPGDSPFQSVVPPSFPTHDTYTLQLWNGEAWYDAGSLTGGSERFFKSGGVDRFRLTGIPESLGLDVDDPLAFVTGLTFVHGGASDTVTLSMTALTADVALEWAAPGAIVYGTPLGPAQLNATSSESGTFAYTPAAGTVLDAGTHALSVVFTPGDPALAIATASVVLQVNQAPLIIRADDVTMTVGDPLPILRATYTGLVNGDTEASLDSPAAISTAATGTTAGTFPILVSGASDPNYAIDFVNGTLTVRQAATLCRGEPDRAVLWPINPDGSSVFKKGSSVIVRFRACNSSGTSINTPGLVRSFVLVHSLDGTAGDRITELPLLLRPTSAFHWNPILQEWFYVLSTRSLARDKTYAYRIGLTDGTAIDLRFGVR
jgi:hypothetical protein